MSSSATAPSGQEALGNEDRALAYIEWRLACLAVWRAYRESGPRGVWRRARSRTRGCGRLRAAGEEPIRAGERARRFRLCVGKPQVAHPRAVRGARAWGRRQIRVTRCRAGISIDQFLLLQADGKARSSQAGTDLLIFA